MNGLRITVLFACLDSLVELVIASLIIWVSTGVNETIYGICIGILMVSLLTFPLVLFLSYASPLSHKFWITLTLLTLFWLTAVAGASFMKGEADQINQLQRHYQQSAMGVQNSTISTKPATTKIAPKSSAVSTTTIREKRGMPTITIVPRSPKPQFVIPIPKPKPKPAPVPGAGTPNEEVTTNDGTSAQTKTQKAAIKIGKELGDIWWALVACAGVMVVWCAFIWYFLWIERRYEKLLGRGI